ncbi:MAG: hypothetical protein NTZ54_00235, partial [Alphaproteobacteria bacterium]|nr:hypothetical protein [Alphaproteobacteria bacterium]
LTRLLLRWRHKDLTLETAIIRLCGGIVEGAENLGGGRSAWNILLNGFIGRRRSDSRGRLKRRLLDGLDAVAVRDRRAGGGRSKPLLLGGLWLRGRLRRSRGGGSRLERLGGTTLLLGSDTLGAQLLHLEGQFLNLAGELADLLLQLLHAYRHLGGALRHGGRHKPDAHKGGSGDEGFHELQHDLHPA